eukprot:CAMPEP_0202837838 /NCGR_PEP_ID=MMETSP1389-20130828/47289_1 /ASSEMBLY_ACC=CAM_ASM_000865 /TAXON_ID=302021 /ORGANISM="Rhodomonas sp., Strain CCMP768" /LENGTH=82 /DNA_ID=CAMNT_0049513985 /DNA_START=7 /DNA_END=255 /DNA_ORIENTATION=+
MKQPKQQQAKKAPSKKEKEWWEYDTCGLGVYELSRPKPSSAGSSRKASNASRSASQSPPGPGVVRAASKAEGESVPLLSVDC